MPSPSATYRRIYAAVSRIPRGRVATYGQIAEVAGLPRQARLVGYALNVLPTGTRVPWHRVVNAQGQISLRSNGLGHDQIQAQLLKKEGVRFVDGAIPLGRYRWNPRRRANSAALILGLAVLAHASVAWSSDDLILPPKAIEPPESMVKGWMEDCKTKGTLKSCYNVAVYYAQTKGDEPKAVEYLRPICLGDYGLGCFNLGGILIKQKATRPEGLAAFRKACKLSRAAAGTEEANDWTRSACSIAGTVEKYQDLDYLALAEKLGLASDRKPARASFDCAKASTAIEKMICSDDQASALDGRLADAYRRVLKQSAQPDALKAEQRAWLTGERNKCADVDCLRQAYEKRAAALEAASPASADGAAGAGAAPAPPADEQTPCSFVRPPFVKPEIVQQLTESGMSDDRPEPRPFIAVDLSDPRGVDRSCGPATTRKAPGRKAPYVYLATPGDFGIVPEFGYSFVGRTTSGVDVLLTMESGGGSMTFVALLLVSVEHEKPGDKRLLLKRVRQIDLGDGWAGDLEVTGDSIVIGKNAKRRIIKVTYKR